MANLYLACRWSDEIMHGIYGSLETSCPPSYLHIYDWHPKKKPILNQHILHMFLSLPEQQQRRSFWNSSHLNRLCKTILKFEVQVQYKQLQMQLNQYRNWCVINALCTVNIQIKQVRMLNVNIDREYIVIMIQ